MIEHLGKPEYIHVLLNPLPVYGLAVGVLGLIIALLSRTRAARVTALALVMAVVGLYAAMAFSVAQRTRELGVRATFADLGATLAQNFELPPLAAGTSFLEEL